MENCPKGCEIPGLTTEGYNSWYCEASTGTVGPGTIMNSTQMYTPAPGTALYDCVSHTGQTGYTCYQENSVPWSSRVADAVQDSNDPTAYGNCNAVITDPEPEDPVIDPVYQPTVGTAYMNCPAGAGVTPQFIDNNFRNNWSGTIDYDAVASTGSMSWIYDEDTESWDIVGKGEPYYAYHCQSRVVDSQQLQFSCEYTGAQTLYKGTHAMLPVLDVYDPTASCQGAQVYVPPPSQHNFPWRVLIPPLGPVTGPYTPPPVVPEDPPPDEHHHFPWEVLIPPLGPVITPPEDPNDPFPPVVPQDPSGCRQSMCTLL